MCTSSIILFPRRCIIADKDNKISALMKERDNILKENIRLVNVSNNYKYLYETYQVGVIELSFYVPVIGPF